MQRSKRPTGTSTAVGPSAPRSLRLLVWFAAALFVALTAWGAGEQMPEMSLPQQGDAAVAAADGGPWVEAKGGTGGPNADLLNSYCSEVPVNGQVPACDEKQEAINLLPAWRWRDATQLASNYGTADVASGKPIMSVLSSFFFAIAQFIWGVLLWVIKIALGMNLADAASGRINAGFASLGSALGGGSGLVIVVLLAGLVAAARALLRGNMPKALGIAIAVMLPIAALQAMTTAATRGGGDVGSLAPTGSPGWVAQRGVGMVNDLGFGVANSMRDLSGQGTQRTPGSETGASENNPNCSQYTSVLYDQYGRFTGQGPANSPTAGSFDNVAVASTVSISDQVSTVSWLWERSFLSGYIQAQFNSLEHGARTYCHQMDHEASISPKEQQVVTQLSYPGLPAQSSDAVFRAHGDRKDQEANIFGWAACRVEGGEWKMLPAWTLISLTNEPDKVCTDWWNKGGPGVSTWKWATLYDVTSLGTTNMRPAEGKGTDVVTACMAAAGEVANNRDLTDTERNEAYADLFEDDEACGKNNVVSDDALPEQMDEAVGTVTGFWGHNVGARLLGSILALLTALAYGYALGAIAVGSIIAQFGLVIMLIILPGTLLLLAFPGQKSGNPSSLHLAGRRLLRMTGGFFIAQVAFVIVMVLLVQTILLLEGLVGGQGGSLWNMFIPLAALFLIRKIIKSTGLGDITKPSGALGLASSAALGADGRANLKAASANRAANRRNKEGLGGAKSDDNMARRFAARMRAGKLNKGLGKSKGLAQRLADSRLGQRYALGQRMTQAFGDKDTGQLGMAQQLRSLAGWAALARGTDPNTLGGKTLRALGRSSLGRRIASMETKPDGSTVYGGFAYRNPLKATSALVAANQRAQRRAEISAVKGKNREERAEARRELLAGRSIAAADRFQASRLADGTVLRDENGSAVYGYVDSAGRHFKVNGDGMPVDSSGTILDRSKLTAVTRPEDYFSNAAMIEIGTEFMEANGLRGKGDFVVNRYGEPPEVVPRLANAAGRCRTPQAKREDQTIELVRSTGTWALSETQKARPPGMSDSSWAYMIARMEEEMGARDVTTGARVDLARENGIDLDTEVGRAELRKEQMGQPSAFDAIRYDIPADRYAAIMSAAMDLDRRDGPRADVVSAARAQRDAEVQQIADEARASAQAIQVRYGAAASMKTKINGTAQRLELTRPKLESAVASASAAQATYEATVAAMPRPAQADELIGLAITFPTFEKFTAASGLGRADFEHATAGAAALATVIDASRGRDALEDQVAELEREQRDAQSRLIAEAEASIADIVAGLADAQKVRSGFELMLADKNKADTSAIIDAAEDFETKELPALRAKLQAEIQTAVAAVQDATAAGDAAHQRAAVNALESLLKRESAKTASTLMTDAAKFPEIISDADLHELSSTRYTDRAVPRSRDYAAIGDAFPD